MGAIVIRTRYDEGSRHFRTYSRCAMFDWSDTVFRRINVTRRRISNTVLQPRYWGREADSPEVCRLVSPLYVNAIQPLCFIVHIKASIILSITINELDQERTFVGRISNTVLQPRYWGREADSPEVCRLVTTSWYYKNPIVRVLMNSIKKELLWYKQDENHKNNSLYLEIVFFNKTFSWQLKITVSEWMSAIQHHVINISAMHMATTSYISVRW
jgi:hypothetical protein